MAALKSKKEKQINLLPQDKLSETTLGRILIWFLSTFRVLIILVEIIVISAFLSRFWLDAKNSDLSEEIKQKEAQIKAMKTTEEEMRNLQEKTIIINDLNSNQKKASELINKIASRIPLNISLSSINLEPEKVKLSGLSKDEVSINQLLINLQSEEEFRETSLSQVGQDEEKSQNLKFTIDIPLKTK